MPNVVDILKRRHLFEDQTSPEVAARLARPSVVYAGFDPSSESLQAGNFVTIMALCHFQRCGHKVVALVGGATGLIGDPSGKTDERQLLSEEQVERNLAGIKENLSRFLDFDHPTAPAKLVNNYDWHRDFTFVSFLREAGRHFRMGAMLGRESVRARLQEENGMSFTEFSYSLLQAYDFLHLYDHCDCRFQIGGSDQWGNITAGIELVRKARGAEVFGLTFPLVCDSSGKKFGKSEGNAIYLDAAKTPVYDFYQFFLRTTDADVVRFLRIFSFLPEDDLRSLAESAANNPQRREAQRVLADDLTRRVHGESGLASARRASNVLFGGEISGLRADELLNIFSDVPSSSLEAARVVNRPVWEVAATAGLCPSRGAARRLVESGGLYLNNLRVEGMDSLAGEADLIDGQLMVLRSGRKSYRLVQVK